EALVLAHADHDVQVARRPAALARVAASGDADALAVGDPGRHVDGHVLLDDLHALAAAGGAGLLGDLAVAAALVAQAGPHHRAEARPLDVLDLPGAAALRARHDRRPRRGAVAAARLAHHAGVVAELHRRAVRRLDQVDRHRDGDVAALDGAAAH